MCRLLTPRVADRPRDDESTHCLHQTAGQHVDRMVDLVLHREDVLVVFNQSNVAVAGIQKYFLCPEVVRRRIKSDDEMARKQILPQRIVVGVGIDENVGEGRGGIANIAAAVENRQKLADLAVDPGDLVACIGRVDRSVVGFIVDDQHRLFDHLRPLLDRVLLQPFQQVLQRAGVFLDHQNDRHVVLSDLAGVGGGGRLVEITQCVGQRNRKFALIELPHADKFLALRLVDMGEPPSVSADEAFIDTGLCLVAQIVMDARDHHDKAIASVGRLADETRIILCFAALDVSDDHAAATPRTGVVRVAQSIENLVRHFIGCVDDRLWQALQVQQLAVPTPVEVSDFAIDPRVVQPGAEILRVNDGAEAHADTVLFFDQTGELFRFTVFDLPRKHGRAAQLRDDVADRLCGMGRRLRRHVHGRHAFKAAQEGFHLSSFVWIVAAMMR